MALNMLNQDLTDSKFNANSYVKSMFGSTFNNDKGSNTYYAKKGEPTYQKDMDSDDDGIVTSDEFREYCKTNNISSKEMAEMLKQRIAYLTSNDAQNQNMASENILFAKEKNTGTLDLIYANDGDDKYDESMDSNHDSKISYKEYLRYCEQNAKTDSKNSDTRIVSDKSRFMTVSFGHASNAYNKFEITPPTGKIESIA